MDAAAGCIAELTGSVMALQVEASGRYTQETYGNCNRRELVDHVCKKFGKCIACGKGVDSSKGSALTKERFQEFYPNGEKPAICFDCRPNERCAKRLVEAKGLSTRQLEQRLFDSEASVSSEPLTWLTWCAVMLQGHFFCEPPGLDQPNQLAGDVDPLVGKFPVAMLIERLCNTPEELLRRNRLLVLYGHLEDIFAGVVNPVEHGGRVAGEIAAVMVESPIDGKNGISPELFRRTIEAHKRVSIERLKDRDQGIKRVDNLVRYIKGVAKGIQNHLQLQAVVKGRWERTKKLQRLEKVYLKAQENLARILKKEQQQEEKELRRLEQQQLEQQRLEQQRLEQQRIKKEEEGNGKFWFHIALDVLVLASGLCTVRNS